MLMIKTEKYSAKHVKMQNSKLDKNCLDKNIYFVIYSPATGSVRFYIDAVLQAKG